MNEGTCIFKCSEQVPVGPSKFLTFQKEGVRSDHYLWLTGKLGELAIGEASSEFPQRVKSGRR